jgi:glyoxylase-like metal-dependent hydrolase (beta-lactamase superfamily II)
VPDASVRIHPVQTGTVTVRERQRQGKGHGQLRLLRTLVDRCWIEPLPVLAWLVEHPEGLIMVDTGETAAASRPGHFPRWHPYFRRCVRLHVSPDDEAGPQLERLGFSPADVRWVVLTHMHTDHAGGLHHFPRSEILVTPEELRISSGTMGRLRGYLPQHLPAWLDARPVEFTGPPLGPFEHTLPLTAAGDVVLLPAAGHTPGHMAVAVRTERALVILAGDASYTQELMRAGAVDGVSPDEGVAKRTLGRFQELAAAQPMIYLPAHDPDSVARLRNMEPA